jgi:hypothetical protein
MKRPFDQLSFVLVVDIYREPDDLHNVLVCFSTDGGRTMQRHLLQSTTVPVSMQSVQQCLGKIVSRLVEGSVFDASSPRAAPQVPSPEQVFQER